MLGEVGLFEELSVLDDEDGYGSVRSSVATFLLVVYLVIITIMLLNLLIAVLSTSHARVAENAELEFKVSKALLIQHYRIVVDRDLLPAPFNLLQLAASSFSMIVDCSWKGEAYRRAKRVVGQVVFWLVLCPVGAAGGTLLWVLSGPYSPLAWRRYYSNHEQNRKFLYAKFMVPWYLGFCVWCLVGAPSLLVVLWIKALLVWPAKFVNRPGSLEHTAERAVRSHKDIVNVHDLLKHAPGGVGATDLRRYLEDPMSDPEVRQDELKRLATVEHLKLLRDRLEKKNNETLQEVLSVMEARMTNLEEGIRESMVEIRDARRVLSESEEGIRERRIGRLDTRRVPSQSQEGIRESKIERRETWM